MGTDGVGDDVFYRTLKGARTAFIISGLTTLIITPVGLILGLIAGYYGKFWDDADSVCLHRHFVHSGNFDADCAGAGVGKRHLADLRRAGRGPWVGLCRLIRGETLKHRDREYVRAAKALGVGDFRILIAPHPAESAPGHYHFRHAGLFRPRALGGDSVLSRHRRGRLDGQLGQHD